MDLLTVFSEGAKQCLRVRDARASTLGRLLDIGQYQNRTVSSPVPLGGVHSASTTHQAQHWPGLCSATPLCEVPASTAMMAMVAMGEMHAQAGFWAEPKGAPPLDQLWETMLAESAKCLWRLVRALHQRY